MPIKKTSSGEYQWGSHGHKYPTKEGAEKQMKAAFASGYTGDEDDFHGAGICLINLDGEALFTKRLDGTWDFPGGKKGENESPEETACRETSEEIGALPYGERKEVYRYKKDGGNSFVLFMQHVIHKFKPKLQIEEHDDFTWSSLSSPPSPLHEGMQEEITSMIKDDVLSQDAMWTEVKHKRDANGKFSSVGSVHTKKEKEGGLTQLGSVEGTELQNLFDPYRRFFHKSLDFSPDKHVFGGVWFAKKREDLDLLDKLGTGEIEDFHLKRTELLDLREGRHEEKDVTKIKESISKAIGSSVSDSAYESLTDGLFLSKHSERALEEVLEALFKQGYETVVLPFRKQGGKLTTFTIVKEMTQVKRELKSKESDTPIQHASDASLAFDRATVRITDIDGRMHVETTNISKANICPYRGSEIPNAEELGLDEDKIYYLYRDADELKNAASTFNNIPLLNTHVPVSAEDHRPDLVVGSTGTDAAFDKPYLKNSLVIWSAEAIKGIESGEQRELSCAYRYTPDMTPGTYNGEHYDGVMRNIIGNHVALVPTGRAGPDVMVGDNLQTEKYPIMSKSLSKKASVVKGALLATFASDAMPDLNEVLKEVKDTNWHDKKPSVIAALKPAMDSAAKVKKLVALFDKLDKFASDEDLEEESAEDEYEEQEGEEEAQDAEEEEPAEDADPCGELLDMLRGKISDEDLELVSEKLQALKGGEAEDEEAPEGAEDNPPPFEGKPEDPVKGQDETEEKETMSKAAMDAAIKDAVKKAETHAVQRMHAIEAAKADVAPYVGKLAIAQDSADGVYKAALDILKVDIEGVHPSAYRAILKAQHKPGEHVPRVAQDASMSDDIATRFPNAVGLRHV